MAKVSPICGRYVYLPVQGDDYRVYFEEAGEGIPLVLMHTAGTDGRLYRHLLEDEEITRDFRVIAPDLPYHGKSLPPVTREWWTEEYKLTTSFLFDFMLAVNEALELDRPVYMGASMGGHLAVDLAISLRGREHRATTGGVTDRRDVRGVDMTGEPRAARSVLLLDERLRCFEIVDRRRLIAELELQGVEQVAARVIGRRNDHSPRREV